MRCVFGFYVLFVLLYGVLGLLGFGLFFFFFWGGGSFWVQGIGLFLCFFACFLGFGMLFWFWVVFLGFLGFRVWVFWGVQGLGVCELRALGPELASGSRQSEP